MKTEKIDLLIIIPPMAQGVTIYPPYGAMYVASAIRQKGYKPYILNLDTEPLTQIQIVERIMGLDPIYIGFSGIVAPSYKFIKELSLVLRKAFPDKLQILGGGLSSAAEVVLKNTAIDIVVRGEGDATILELMDSLRDRKDLGGVLGIYFKDGSTPRYTGPRKLIMNLDELPYPAFDLVDMERYLPDALTFMDGVAKGIVDKKLYENRKKRRMMTIPTSRGCFNECSFCFRAYPGLRVHSIKYVFDLIEYCMKKFDVEFFTLGDECFAPTKKRNWEFIEEFKRRKLNIVFRIFGMRVDTVDQEILRSYKEIGCWMIEYGFESGSQKMLNIINKRVVVQQNIDTARWTQEAGIYTSPALVLAMPGETTATIKETINFLKSIDLGFKQYQWKYAIPIPGSQLYEFAKISGAIEDEDAYLLSLVDDAASGSFNVNLTDEPDEVVASWETMLQQGVDEHYFYRKYNIKNPFIMKLIHFVRVALIYHKKKTLMKAIAKKIKKRFGNQGEAKPDATGRRVRFRKTRNVNIEAFFKEIDTSSLNKDMALKNINRKIREAEGSVHDAL
jgi:anaerobic magnesium-protoporphyrin IX monomethyl ester cyclase